MIFRLLLLFSLVAIDVSGQNTAHLIRPVLRLEKPKYVLGESIRFWVGVQKDGGGAIPNDQRNPCSLLVTKPDGSIESQTILWPMDGNPDSGWIGGWGIKGEEAGLYALELDCSGQRTQRVPLIVEADEIIHEIHATFTFGKSGSVKTDTRVPVFFRVTNDSAFPIRFPQRGAMMEGISISVKRKSPAYQSDFFYPWTKLTQFALSPDTYTWEFASQIPSVTLEPGGQFEQRLVLDDAYTFEEPGSYRITFSTAISVLVGDEQGPYSNHCPMRIVAENTESFAVSDARTPSVQ